MSVRLQNVFCSAKNDQSVESTVADSFIVETKEENYFIEDKEIKLNHSNAVNNLKDNSE